jgi:hypothetical protein
MNELASYDILASVMQIVAIVTLDDDELDYDALATAYAESVQQVRSATTTMGHAVDRVPTRR